MQPGKLLNIDKLVLVDLYSGEPILVTESLSCPGLVCYEKVEQLPALTASRKVLVLNGLNASDSTEG
jgi:hypothetical protein